MEHTHCILEISSTRSTVKNILDLDSRIQEEPTRGILLHPFGNNPPVLLSCNFFFIVIYIYMYAYMYGLLGVYISSQIITEFFMTCRVS